MCESKSLSVVSDSLRPHGLYSPWNSPGQNTAVVSLSQGIFPIQGSNPALLHCRQILNQLSHKGSPRILEWVAYPFSSGSSRPRNQTGGSCIAGRFFTSWAIRQARKTQVNFLKRFLPCFSFPKKTHLTITYKPLMCFSKAESSRVTGLNWKWGALLCSPPVVTGFNKALVTNRPLRAKST